MSSAEMSSSPWLLPEEPDLSPEQVWMGWATTGQGGLVTVREGVVLADTEEQAMQALVDARWTPSTVMSEAALSAHLARARATVAGRGAPRDACFALLFADTPPSLRWRWIRTAPTTDAQHAWRLLDEPQAPLVILPLATVEAVRDRLQQVRVQRGEGAIADGRSFEQPHVRQCALEAQTLPGGRAQFEAEVQALLELRRRLEPQA